MKFLEILSNSMELSEEADNIVLSLVFQSPVNGGNGNGKGMFFWALVSGCPTRRGVSSLFPEWQHFPPISQCMPGKAVMVQIDVCSPTCRTYCYPPFGSFFLQCCRNRPQITTTRACCEVCPCALSG